MIEFEKVSRYDIVEKIAESPFAVVYRGRDGTSRRPVAIKVCIAADSAFRQRFLRLAEASAPLRHPHIVEILEFGSGDGKPYLIEEFLTGEDLRHRIARRGLVDGERELSLLAEVARGLEYAHQKGVLHQDLKPATVHLEDGERVKLVDFGIARLASAATRLASPAAFSAAGGYLPPEQALGLPADARTDVFCFGALAYELLSRHPPFPGSSPAELLDRALVGRPVPLADLWPDCPPAFSALVDRCLSASPGDRHASFDELNEDLTPIVDQLRGRKRRLGRRLDETAGGRALSLDDTMAIPPDLAQAQPPPASGTDARDESLKTAYILPARSLDDTRESTLAVSAPSPAPVVAVVPAASPAAAEGPAATAAVTRIAAAQPLPARLPWMPAAPPQPVAAAAPPQPAVAAAPPQPKTQPVRPTFRRRPRWLMPSLAAAGLLVTTGVLMSLRTEPSTSTSPAATARPAVPAARPAAPPPAAANLGWLVIDATPWAQVVRVVDEAGREVSLPAGRFTPLALRLPAGRFRAELVRPGAPAPASCQAVVAAGGSAPCRADLGRVEAVDYFKEAGWWR